MNIDAKNPQWSTIKFNSETWKELYTMTKYYPSKEWKVSLASENQSRSYTTSVEQKQKQHDLHKCRKIIWQNPTQFHEFFKNEQSRKKENFSTL
jgi:hypothetical protein